MATPTKKLYHLEKENVYGCWKICTKNEYDTTINLVETNLHHWHDIHTLEMFYHETHLIKSSTYPSNRSLLIYPITAMMSKAGIRAVGTTCDGKPKMFHNGLSLLKRSWQGSKSKVQLVFIKEHNEATVYMTLFINFSSRSTPPKSLRNWAPALRSLSLSSSQHLWRRGQLTLPSAVDRGNWRGGLK